MRQSLESNSILLGLLGITLLLGWQWMKADHMNRQYRHQLASIDEQLRQHVLQSVALEAIKEQNQLSYDFYDSLGHALAALHIQLQTAHKLWQIDPEQAKTSLALAQQLSSSIMVEIRQVVKVLGKDAGQTPPDSREVLNDSTIASR